MCLPLISRHQQSFLLLTDLAVKSRQALSHSPIEKSPSYAIIFSSLQALATLQDNYQHSKNSSLSQENKVAILFSLILSPGLYALAHKIADCVQCYDDEGDYKLSIANDTPLCEIVYRLTHVAHLTQSIAEIAFEKRNYETLLQVAANLSCLIASHQITYLHTTATSQKSRKKLFDEYLPLPLPQKDTCSCCHNQRQTFPIAKERKVVSCLTCVSKMQKNRLYKSVAENSKSTSAPAKGSLLSKLKGLFSQDFYLSFVSPGTLLLEKALIQLFKEKKISLNTFSRLLLLIEIPNMIAFFRQFVSLWNEKSATDLGKIPQWQKIVLEECLPRILMTNFSLLISFFSFSLFLLLQDQKYRFFKGNNKSLININGGRPEIILPTSSLHLIVTSHLIREFTFFFRCIKSNDKSAPSFILHCLLLWDFLSIALQNPKCFYEGRRIQ